MSETVKVSRLGRTLASITMAAIIFIPSGFLLTFMLSGLGIETIPVRSLAFFWVGWMIMDFAMSAWKGRK